MISFGQDSINWNMWEAIGTLLASGVAFFIAFLPSILKWWNRPQVTMIYDNKEPYCRIILERYVYNIPNNDINTYVIRIKVMNNGKSTAEKCEGKITEIKLLSDEEFQPFDPTLLHWANYSYPSGSIQLAQGEYEYLSIFKIYENNTKNLHITKDINIPMNDYVIKISVYGDNFSPVVKRFKIKGNNVFDKVLLEEL